MINIEIQPLDKGVIDDLENINDRFEDIEVIYAKNFSGNFSDIQVFVENSLPVVSALVGAIATWIIAKRVKKIVIDGEKIELENISDKQAAEILKMHFKLQEEKLSQSNVVDESNSNRVNDFQTNITEN